MQKNTELPFIRDMFESIAPRYDLLNRLLSLRQDVYWRRVMVSKMDIPKNAKVLDVACGTGDVVLEILRQKGPGVRVVGVDFSPSMMLLAKEKIVGNKIPSSRNGSGKRAENIFLAAGDAFYLPFKSETFNAITIAFGIRNIQDKLTVLKYFYDYLKPGGMLLILELAAPPRGGFLSLYLFYFKKILPLIGWFFSKNLTAYQYLPDSVLHFPKPDSFAAMMESAGFSGVKWKKLTLGIAVLYIGCK